MNFMSVVAIEAQLMLNLNRKLNAMRAQKIMAERAKEDAARQEEIENEFIKSIIDTCAHISAKQVRKSQKSVEKEISALKADNERLKEQIESLIKKMNEMNAE